MRKKPLDPITRARRRLCLQLAEDANAHCRKVTGHGALDVDELARDFETVLPLTYAEADAEWEEFKEECREKARTKVEGPSILDRLREALGLGNEVLLRQMLEAAIERIQAHTALKQTLAEVKEMCASEIPNQDTK